MSTETFEFTIPVLVIGGGACGCIAALAAAQEGAEVLLVEQDSRPMGSTGMSQGLICAAGTRSQVDNGIADGPDQLYRDIMEKTRDQADPVAARIIADHSGATVDWMVDSLKMPWALDTGFRPGYGNSTYRVHGWHGHSGQDMLDLLHQRLAEAGVDALLGARLDKVHSNAEGRVIGVSLVRPDGEVELVGCDTLILASGGYAANHELLAQYIPEMAEGRNNGHEGSQGIAVQVGLELGAALGDMGAYQGYGMLTEPQGVSVPPNVLINGGILINCEGERFVDETEDIAGVVQPVMQQQADFVWVIYDQRIEDKVAYVPETQQLNELKAPRVAESCEALAEKIQVPIASLKATLAAAESARERGEPDTFGRVWNEDLPPHGNLRALKVVGAIYHTQGGLQINSEARVVREDGSPLPNVFAGGGAARSVSGPAHWGYLPAMGLSTAVTLGRIAGIHAAQLSRETEAE